MSSEADESVREAEQQVCRALGDAHSLIEVEQEAFARVCGADDEM